MLATVAILAVPTGAHAATVTLVKFRERGSNAPLYAMTVEDDLGEADEITVTAGVDRFVVHDSRALGARTGCTAVGAGDVECMRPPQRTGTVTIKAGLGDDFVTLAGAFAGPGQDSPAGVYLEGSGGDDTLTGSDSPYAGANFDPGPGHDVVQGGPSEEVFHGLADGDTLSGAGGNDGFDERATVGAVPDEIDGGPGEDRILFTGFNLAAVDLAGGRVWLDGRSGTLTAVEHASVGANRAYVRGTDGPNQLSGGAGDDVLVGAGGDDHLQGYVGRDTYAGGDGDDLIDLGYGERGDRVGCGSGFDRVNNPNAGVEVAPDCEQLVGDRLPTERMLRQPTSVTPTHAVFELRCRPSGKRRSCRIRAALEHPLRARTRTVARGRIVRITIPLTRAERERTHLWLPVHVESGSRASPGLYFDFPYTAVIR